MATADPTANDNARACAKCNGPSRPCTGPRSSDRPPSSSGVPGLIKSNWGAVMRPYDRGLDRFGAPEVYVEVVPVAHVADGEEVSGRSVAA